MQRKNESIRIPFQLSNDVEKEIRIKGEIDNKPVVLCVDTGSSSGVVFAKNTIFNTYFPKIEKFLIHTSDGKLDITASRFPVLVTEFGNDSVVGVISLSVFGEKVVEFDLDRLEIIVSDSIEESKYPYQIEAETDEFQFTASFSSDGKKIPGIIDTGSPFVVLQDKFETNRSRKWKEGADGIVVSFLGSQKNSRLLPIMMPEFSFDKSEGDYNKMLKTTNIFACINTDIDSFGASLIGMSFLRRFNFAFDKKRQRIFFRPRNVPEEKYFLPGIEIEVQNGTPFVYSVRPDSPIDKAGVDFFDILIAINGKKIAKRSDIFENLWISNKRSKIKLRVERKGKPIDITFENYDVFSKEPLINRWGFGFYYLDDIFSIDNIEESGIAWKKGVRDKDIIVEINGIKPGSGLVKTLFFQVIKPSKILSLKVMRGKKIMTFLLKSG